MARSPRDGGSRYALRFAGAIVFVMAVTLLLVFYVFPERYVLDSGFRESVGQRVTNALTLWSAFDLWNTLPSERDK